MEKTILTFSLLAILGACQSSSTRALIGNPQLPEMPEVNYKLVGPVQGEGSAITICPGVQGFFGAKSTVQKAEEDAVGAAIFDRNDVDLVVAPKTKVQSMNVLNIFETAKVTVKGQGVKLEK